MSAQGIAMSMAGHDLLTVCADMITVKSAVFSFEPDMARRARTASRSSMNLCCSSCHLAAP
eukprot:6009817-Prymnesium_polylepis.1